MVNERTIRLWVKSVFTCLVFPLFLAYGAAGSQAQGWTIVWTEPINLSVGTPGRSFQPMVVADRFGYVHVFWEESVELSPGVSGGYLFYTRWDGKQWSRPVDILLSPGVYSIVSKPCATVDQDAGMLHLVWASSDRLLYSRAPVEEAQSARNWSEPTTVAYGPVQDPYLIIHQGVLHLVYLDNGEEPGIYYTASQDRGDSWLAPVRLSPPTATRKPLPTVSETVQIRADEQGRLHVVWVDRLDGGIYYTRSTNAGQSWEQPVELDNEGTWPSLGILGNQVHVLWSATHEGPSCARRERISPDGGLSWDQMTRILAPVEGCLGWMTVEQDDTGALHLFTIGRDDHGIVRPYYARWTGTGWSEPEAVGTIAVKDGPEWQRKGPDRARASLGQGNLLHVVWYSNDGEIWYARAQVSASGQSPAPLPTRPATLLATPSATPTETPMPPGTATPFAITRETRPPTQPGHGGSTLSPVLVGSGLTGFLVLLIILLARKHHAR